MKVPDGKYFRFGYAVALILLIIFLGTLVDFIFTPVVILIQTVFAPLALAGVLFYLFRPVVKLLARKMPKVLAITVIYLVFIGLMTLLVILVGPEIQRQFYSLVDVAPRFINQAQNWFNDFMQSDIMQRFQENETFSLEEIIQNVGNYLSDAFADIGSNIASFIGAITSAVIVIAIVPFILFYMLKEGEKAPQQILRLLPSKQRNEGKRILSDMDGALANFIQGQIIVSFCVGVLVYIAYLIIGIEYSLVLALIAMFTNLIPFIGPWIGTAPGVIVALFDGWLTAIAVIVAVVIIQQFESIFISPQVMGRKLQIHPITVIFILLVAANFAGIIGMLLAVPTYAVAKVIVSHTYRLIRLRYKETHSENKGG
ncbi:AI-2E family transporter [Geomicrobium sediminis]|uniref:AI-2E family transporter n=1 Tax=Geomicrobium sediminis TaxID=1347788 RepID=UPI001EF9A52E|nr:AI-2E family transporter [Geomicrobium sediminis]